MTQVEILNAERGGNVGYKVDVSRGERIGRVSSEWFSRPADERYLSLSELFSAVYGRTERSRTRTVESAAIRVEAKPDDSEEVALVLPGSDARIALTHWSFGQLAESRPCAGDISASASCTARRHQSAIWAELASRRAGEDAGDRRRPR